MKPVAHADFVMHAVNTFFSQCCCCTIIIHYFPVSKPLALFLDCLCLCCWPLKPNIPVAWLAAQLPGQVNYLAF